MKKILVCLAISILAANLVFAMGGKPPEPDRSEDYVIEESQATPQEEVATEEAGYDDQYQEYYEPEVPEDIPKADDVEVY